MTLQSRLLPDAAFNQGVIDDDGILALRRQIWPDGVIALAEVEHILALDEQVLRPSKAWIDFFVEALSEFVLNTSEPRGTVSEAQADWLIMRLQHDGRINTPARLELLVHLVEKFDGTPERMNAYILVQIERAVIFGIGPTRDSSQPDIPPAGCITATECALIRRIIFAPSSLGFAHVSVEEAELLFRIKDAPLGADNASEWQSLFVQGVANYLQAWRGLSIPAVEQENAHERFLAARSAGISSYLRQMVRTSATGLRSAKRISSFGRRQSGSDYVAEARSDYIVTAAEQRRFCSHVTGDSNTDPLENALIAFLHDDTVLKG